MPLDIALFPKITPSGQWKDLVVKASLSLCPTNDPLGENIDQLMIGDMIVKGVNLGLSMTVGEPNGHLAGQAAGADLGQVPFEAQPRTL